MARTIESPGVEIREIDLTNVTTLPVGTNVFVQGFANRGPVNELINITSTKEFEQLYGAPTNAAEKYFYETAKQVLNSPGRLVVNRLPYGAAEGTGSSRSQSALIFPYVPAFDTVTGESSVSVESVTDIFTTTGDTIFTLTEDYNSGGVVQITDNVDQGTSNTFNTRFVVDTGATYAAVSSNPSNPSEIAEVVINTVVDNGTFSTVNLANTVNTDDVTIQYSLSTSEYTFSAPNFLTLVRSTDTTLVGLTADYTGNVDVVTPYIDYNAPVTLTKGSTAADLTKGFVLGRPVLFSNLTTDQVDSLMNGEFFSNTTNFNLASATAFAQITLKDTETPTADQIALAKQAAGLIVLNSNYTNVESDYTGYYFGVNDNLDIDDDTYDKFKYVQTRDGGNNWIDLAAKNVTLKTDLSGSLTGIQDSISQQVEIGPSWSDTFGDNDGKNYQHSLQFSLWKVYKSEDESQGNDVVLRSYPAIPTFLGSFDPNYQDSLNNPYGGAGKQSLYLENTYKTVGAKPWLDFVVNPLIRDTMTTNKFIRVLNSTQELTTDPVVVAGLGSSLAEAVDKIGNAINSVDSGLFAIGPYSPTNTATAKQTGNLVGKIERGLSLAENLDLVPLDLVLDAGLSTVNAAVAKVPQLISSGTYNDAVYFPDLNTGAGKEEWLSVYNVLNNFCSETRKDCMAIIDPLRHIFVQNADTKVLSSKSKTFSQDVLKPLRELVASTNSSYAATYGNWVKAFDTATGEFFWAPFSGFQAAIMARVDSLLQPWFAPAGLNNGIVRNAVDLAITPNQRERDLLYRYGINPVTSFPRDGFVVFGQKTLQAKPSAFDRINVRRLFLFLEKATRQLAKYFVFEPNTVFTRTRFVNVLTPIFELAKRNQGVYDYLIVCDERNNSSDVIDRNELVVDIYIKPVRTAEFILINFVATRTGANFEEIISGTGA